MCSSSEVVGRIRPAESTEAFSSHLFAKTQTSSDPTIAPTMSFELQNRTVAWREQLVLRRTPRRTTSGTHQAVQSSGLEPLLKTA